MYFGLILYDSFSEGRIRTNLPPVYEEFLQVKFSGTTFPPPILSSLIYSYSIRCIVHICVIITRLTQLFINYSKYICQICIQRKDERLVEFQTTFIFPELRTLGYLFTIM